MTPTDEINLLFQQAVIANSNKKPLNKVKLFSISTLAPFVIFVLFSFPLYNQTKKAERALNETAQMVVYDTTISNQEKIVLRKLVKQLAEKEHRHVNSIHAELRHRFNYRSYHHLDQRTYNKVKNYLSFRLSM
ncbi:MAG: hypothetical protein IJY92_02940 [Alphaproteobacteria bacterium]|nr:hypothetical protein [Alphaproteobacteria bacterium]